MKAQERRAIMLTHRQRHIEQPQKLGYIYSNMNAIKMLETKANTLAMNENNGDITDYNANREEKRITANVKRLFGGKLPKGFFFNGDSRGYALKLNGDDWKVSDDARENYEARPISYTDWGDYMILAPEEF